MARKTTGKKTVRRKTRSSARSRTSSAVKKKKTARRTTAAGRAKKTTKKKSSKKKTAKKRTAAKKPAARKTAGKRKTASKKKVAARSRTSARTTASRKKKKKKIAARASAGRKKTATTRSKTAATKKTTTRAKAATPAKKASSTTRKRKTLGGRRAAKSVAEVASSADVDEKGYVYINGRRVRMISTRGHVPSRKTRNDAAVVTPEAETERVKKPVKTHLSRKQLNQYRSLLLIKRAELVGDLNSLETEALRSSGGNLSHMPIHMADIGSDTYEQDFMLGLAENERARLREIDDALARIAAGIYGICQMTGEPIPEARLEAKPWAKYTIEAARKLEQGWGT